MTRRETGTSPIKPGLLSLEDRDGVATAGQNCCEGDTELLLSAERVLGAGLLDAQGEDGGRKQVQERSKILLKEAHLIKGYYLNLHLIKEHRI